MMKGLLSRNYPRAKVTVQRYENLICVCVTLKFILSCPISQMRNIKYFNSLKLELLRVSNFVEA